MQAYDGNLSGPGGGVLNPNHICSMYVLITRKNLNKDGYLHPPPAPHQDMKVGLSTILCYKIRAMAQTDLQLHPPVIGYPFAAATNRQRFYPSQA